MFGVRAHPCWPDLPIEELPMWDAVRSRDPQHTPDWDTEERFPRFKEWAKKIGLGSGVRVPLTTPHRRLGVFGINRDTVNPFSEEEISFLRLIGRVVAFALDDGLNLRRAQHQNDQLQLLLDLTNRITSNLELRDLLRAIAANIRDVIRADAVDSCAARCCFGEIQGICHGFSAWKRGRQGRVARYAKCGRQESASTP